MVIVTAVTGIASAFLVNDAVVLLLFFSSLFIVVRAVEIHGIFEPFIELADITEGIAGMTGVHLISLILSQVVSNVPMVILLVPVLKSTGSELLYLALASSSTLAGNATIIGAMANLIVLESAKREGVEIGFMEFLKPGLVVLRLSWCRSFREPQRAVSKTSTSSFENLNERFRKPPRAVSKTSTSTGH
ncbi:MAG: hypothetical protein N2316_12865 [Spirochaetes bacterium]|nr:hypothetical protein [Spirochaetota bacterium]